MINKFINQRIKKLQKSLADHQAILLSKNSDIFYFSSFFSSVPEERSAFLLISKNSSYLILQNFLAKPKSFSGNVLTGLSTSNLTKQLNDLKDQENFDEIFLDLENLSVNEFKAVTKIDTFKISTLDKKVIWQLRVKKDLSEIKKIKKAQSITRKVIGETIKELRTGLSELQVKKILENKILQHNFCDLAFPSIIAFDKNSTLPHHQSGNKKLKNGMVVLLDAGAKYQGYCADMTRTIFFTEKNSKKTKSAEIAKKEKEFKKILKIVKDAYKKAEKMLYLPSATAASIDLVCREYIMEKGYAKNFIHTTGHGLGLDIHEPPSIYKTNEAKIIPGMVLTIEPGIYLEGKFGVRWENTLFV